MYNLEVAHDHTFVVGDGQWVVHNFDCTSLVSQATDTLTAGGKAVSNIIDTVTNNPVIRNSGKQLVTQIGNESAFIQDGVSWSGHCAETRCAAEIAWLFQKGRATISGGGDVIEIGMAQGNNLPPCPACMVNLQILAQETGKIVTLGFQDQTWIFEP